MKLPETALNCYIRIALLLILFSAYTFLFGSVSYQTLQRGLDVACEATTTWGVTAFLNDIVRIFFSPDVNDGFK